MRALANRCSPLVFLTGIICLYLLCAGSIFLSYLPPQTDEELFSEPAKNLAIEGRLVSHIVLGMDEGVFWQPPLYFVVLAGMIAIFGYSLEVVRAFNIVIGGAVLILTYILGRKLFSEKSARIAVFLLSFDPVFLLYSKMGRMDILCLAFVLSSLCLAWWSSSRVGSWPWVLTGLSSAAAVLTHPLGAIAPISVVIWQISHRADASRGRTISILAFLTPLFIVVLATALYLWNHMSPFMEQMAFQFGRKNKNLIASWSDWLLHFRFLPVLGATTLFCLAVSLKSTLRQWRTSSTSGLAFIVTSLFIIGIASAFETSYQLYVQPFVLLIFCSVICEKRTGPVVRWESLIPIFPAALGLNFAVYLVLLNVGLHEARRDDTACIGTLFERIAILLPVGSRVIALGSPSLYWQLRTERPDIVFVSDTFLSEKRGREGVGKIDRVVMTRSFDPGSDDRWHATEYQRMEGIAETFGRHLVKIASVGTRKRFSYSAVVFKVEKDDNAHSSYP